MKPAASLSTVLILVFLAHQRLAGAQFLSLYGLGLSGYRVVSLGDYTSSLAGLPSSIPLASGLSLTGTTAYRDSSLSPAPSSQCITTSLSLFTDCSAFLRVLVDNGGTLTGTTILGLLTVAQNATADSVCLTATLNFLNQGCTCSLTIYNLLQSFPTSTVPQLIKIAVNVLANLLCPSGLVSPTPVSAPPTTIGTPFVPVPPSVAVAVDSTGGPPPALVPPTTTTATAAAFGPPLGPPLGPPPPL